MLKQDPVLCEALGVEVREHKIIQKKSRAILKGLPAKASSNEGLSIYTAILDEVHCARGRMLHDVLSAGCSKRENSLFIQITTAGDDSAGIAAELREFLERVLLGEAEDESYFAIFYTYDGTAWDQPVSWEMANPCWGISVDPRAIAEEAKRAQQMPGLRKNFRIKHLCEWLANGGEGSFLDSLP